MWGIEEQEQDDVLYLDVYAIVDAVERREEMVVCSIVRVNVFFRGVLKCGEVRCYQTLHCTGTSTVHQLVGTTTVIASCSGKAMPLLFCYSLSHTSIILTDCPCQHIYEDMVLYRVLYSDLKWDCMLVQCST